MGPTSPWGLHLINWYLCVTPKHPTWICTEVVSGLAERLPDIARHWKPSEVEPALFIISTDEGENGEKSGVLVQLGEDKSKDVGGGGARVWRKFKLLAKRLPSAKQWAQQVGGVWLSRSTSSDASSGATLGRLPGGTPPQSLHSGATRALRTCLALLGRGPMLS